MKRLTVVAVAVLIVLSALQVSANPQQVREFAETALQAALAIEKPVDRDKAVDEALVALALVDVAKAKTLIPEGEKSSSLLDALLSADGCPGNDEDLIPFFLISARKDPANALARFQSASLSGKQEVMALAGLTAGAKLAGNDEVVKTTSHLIEGHGSKVDDWLDQFGGDDSGIFSLTCWMMNQVSTELTTKFARRIVANSVEEMMSLERINVQCQIIAAMAVSSKSAKALMDEIKPVVSKLVKGNPRENDTIGENYSSALDAVKVLNLLPAMLKKIEQALIKPANDDDKEIRDAMLETMPDQLVKVLAGLVVFKNWNFLSSPSGSRELIGLSLEMVKKSDWPDGSYANIALAMSIYNLSGAIDLAKKIKDPGEKSTTYANLAHIAFFEGSPVLIYRLSECFGLLAGGASMTFN